MAKYFVYVILLFFALSWTANSFAQLKPDPILNDPHYDFEKRLRFGFSLGTNFMDFQIESNPLQGDTTFFVNNSVLRPGFNVNVVSDFRILPTLNLRFLPGLAFGQRDLYFYDKNNPTEPFVMPIESSFIEMPLSIKYSAVRKWNARPYLIAGTNFRIDMAAYKGPDTENKIYLTLVKADFYYELGFGIDFFLTYFKFSTEIKFSSGLRNALAPFTANDDSQPISKSKGYEYFKSISYLKSQIVTLSFHFE